MIERVQVLGKTYRVEEVPDHILSGNFVGNHSGRTLLISVLDNLADDQKRETVLHEVIHALNLALALGLDERQVSALSNGLYALAHGDPEATRYMLGLDKETAVQGSLRELRFPDAAEDALETIRQERERLHG